ncbi:putative hexose carrier protein [Dipodascopsis uninucleata]
MYVNSPSYLKLRGQNLVSIGFLLFGYDIGYISGVTTADEFLKVFGYPNASLLGFIVSAYEVGAMFGALFQFLIGDRYGRKVGILGGTVVIFIGAVLQTSSFGLTQFLVGRVIAGLGLGAITTVIPVWLTECSIPKSRGRMMAMQLSNLIMGLIISNWLDYGMSKYPGSVMWRVPCAFQIVFCILILCYVPFLPESPRYLFSVGRKDQATHTLCALRAGFPEDPDIEKEIQEINYAIAVESEEVGSWSEVFKDNGISGFTRTMLSFVANFLQQMTGVNIMSSLGSYILQESVGLNHYDALLVSGGMQIFYFLSSIIPWFIIDRIGRRKLFMIGSAGMGSCMVMSAILVGIGTKACGYGAIVFLYIFQTFFTLGWQSNMWVYPSELMPLKLRLRGGAIAVISQWLFGFVVVEITPPMIDSINYKAYIIFAIFNFITIPIVYYCFPETSKRPLEVVDLLFADRDGKRPSIFRVVRDSTDKGYIEMIEKQLEERAEQNNADIMEEKEKLQHFENIDA